MSVLFLPPASAASVPDATEAVSGKIRIATSAEATAGTLDTAAMTPLKVKSVVDAAVVGGVTYQGTFDTSSPVDLSNAEKGDLYIISVAGSYQGITWAVGDHLLVNADMGGTISPSKLDKVDNTDAVTSVAGRTGAVTLSASDVSGLAAVATSGAYSDLSGTPTLGTAAAEDVGTAASNVVQLDGSARLPAVDGSQLLNLPSGATTLGALTDVDVTGVANTNVIKYNSTSGDWEDGAVAYSEVTGTPTLATVATTGAYSDLSGTPTLGTAAAEDVGIAASNVVQLDGSARLPAVDGSQLINLPSGATTLGGLSDVTITSVANGEAILYNSTSGEWENGTVSGAVTSVAGKTGAVTLSTDDLTDMDTTTAAPVAEDRFKYDGSNWVPVAPFEVVTTVTTSTALTVPEQEQLVRTSGSGITLTLPNIASNSIPAGVRYQLKVTDANTITVAPNGAELLEGSNSSYSTSGAKEALTVICDGSGWWFV